MERCPTCGAAVRAGAKFCTSCGTRLDEGTETQETMIATPSAAAAEPVTPEPDWAAASGGAVDDETQDEGAGEAVDASGEVEATETPVDADNSWARKWPEARTTEAEASSPADRFRSGLDEEASETSETPTDSAWSWGGTSETAVPAEGTGEDELPAESATIVPDAGVPPAVADGDRAPAATPENASQGDPRRQASDLLDEVRTLIWQIGSEAHTGDSALREAIQTIRRIRGETSDFGDLGAVIAAAQERPRDIDALLELGQKADRLRALLDSHTRLVDALEDAIGE